MVTAASRTRPFMTADALVIGSARMIFVPMYRSIVTFLAQSRRASSRPRSETATYSPGSGSRSGGGSTSARWAIERSGAAASGTLRIAHRSIIGKAFIVSRPSPASLGVAPPRARAAAPGARHTGSVPHGRSRRPETCCVARSHWRPPGLEPDGSWPARRQHVGRLQLRAVEVGPPGVAVHGRADVLAV